MVSQNILFMYVTSDLLARPTCFSQIHYFCKLISSRTQVPSLWYLPFSFRKCKISGFIMMDSAKWFYKKFTNQPLYFVVINRDLSTVEMVVQRLKMSVVFFFPIFFFSINLTLKASMVLVFVSILAICKWHTFVNTVLFIINIALM